MSSENFHSNAILLVIALGLLAWAFSIALMPESAFTDALHHLTLSKSIAETGIVKTDSALNPPLYHIIAAGFITVFGFNSWAFKAVAFLFAIAFLLSCYFLFKKLLPKDHGLALVLTLFNPVLLLYFSTNYTDVSAALFLVLSCFFLFRFNESKTAVSAGCFLVFIALGFLSKATFWVAVPVLLIAFCYSIFRKDKSFNAKAMIALVAAYFVFALIAGEGSFYYRYFIPAFPLLSVLLVLLFNKKLLKFKAIFISLILIASLVSLIFTVSTILAFKDNFDSQQDFYQFLSGLPKDSRIVVMPNDERRVKFYSGIDAIYFQNEFNSLENSRLISRLKALNATHIGIVCYKDFWYPEKISILEKAGLIKKQFQGKCSQVFRIE
ncbi:MAG: glycosyltransferase family 39 protein [Candidatus Diapherotrites archaeon]|nr:glycosyltransferase family 39 protein [Candidatus Diapherotrites archaeon]